MNQKQYSDLKMTFYWQQLDYKQPYEFWVQHLIKYMVYFQHCRIHGMHVNYVSGK